MCAVSVLNHHGVRNSSLALCDVTYPVWVWMRCITIKLEGFFFWSRWCEGTVWSFPFSVSQALRESFKFMKPTCYSLQQDGRVMPGSFMATHPPSRSPELTRVALAVRSKVKRFLPVFWLLHSIIAHGYVFNAVMRAVEFSARRGSLLDDTDSHMDLLKWEKHLELCVASCAQFTAQLPFS